MVGIIEKAHAMLHHTQAIVPGNCWVATFLLALTLLPTEVYSFLSPFLPLLVSLFSILYSKTQEPGTPLGVPTKLSVASAGSKGEAILFCFFFFFY